MMKVIKQNFLGRLKTIFDMMIWIAILVGGILLMAFSSDKAIEHSVILTNALGISPLLIGLVFVSLGTDLPEIVNSIISGALRHGDINAGDSIGSVLTQITLVFGLLPLLGRAFKVKRKEILVIGGCEVLSLMLVFSIVEKGYISRINALFLVGSWPIYVLITRTLTKRDVKRSIDASQMFRNKKYHISIAMLGFIGVAVGAYAMVQSTIMLSAALKIPEYFISFFLLSIGTSLPELAVDLTAIRKKEYEIAVGDIIGSCIVDASLSIGIGQVFFPQAVSGELASTTILYTIFASFTVISILALRERMDKKAGIIFIILYLLSYITLAV